MPSGDRASLGEALSGLDQIARANKLTEDKRLVAFLDQGIFGSPGHAAALSAALGLDQYCDVKSEQDSRSVKGLQLADLVAHKSPSDEVDNHVGQLLEHEFTPASRSVVPWRTCRPQSFRWQPGPERPERAVRRWPEKPAEAERRREQRNALTGDASLLAPLGRASAPHA